MVKEQLSLPRNIDVEQTTPRRSTRDSAPLSFAQQRLWFLNQLDSESPTYNYPQAALLRGQLDLPALQNALDHVVARHQVLRTTFMPVDGIPVRVIAQSRNVHSLSDEEAQRLRAGESTPRRIGDRHE
jgi:hypothetical protein